MKSVANQVLPDRRAGLLAILLAVGCGSVTTAEEPLTAIDGGAGHDGGAAGGAAGTTAAAGSSGTAGASSSGAAGAIERDAGAEAAPAPACFVATSAAICWINLSTDHGCFQGCKDSSGADVAGPDCTSAGVPHHAACVPYCSLCPPQN